MAKKVILLEASKTRTFGYNRVAGVFPVVKAASYNKSFTNRDNEVVNMEALAIFLDKEDETVLDMNGLHKPHFALNDDGTAGTHIVKANGTFISKFMSECFGKTYFDICEIVNKPENGYVGKFIAISWIPYRSADLSYSGASYYPHIDIFDTEDEAKKSLE